MRRSSIAIASLFVIACLLGVTVPTTALAGVGVSPSKVRFNLNGSSKVMANVRVFNTGRQEISITCTFLDFEIDDDGLPASIGSEKGLMGCSKWLEVTPSMARIAPDAYAVLAVSAAAPDGARPGGYASYLRIVAQAGRDVGLNQKSVIDALMLVSLQGSGGFDKFDNPPLKVDIKIADRDRLWLDGPLPVLVRVNNPGEFPRDISGVLKLNMPGGMMVESIMPENVVFAHSSRTIQNQVDFPDRSGIARLSFNPPKNIQADVSGSTPVLVLSKYWQATILILLAIATLFFIRSLYKRRTFRWENR